MATKTHEQIKIEFMDGTSIDARPLKISLLKEFMKTFAGLAPVADDNEKSMDVLIECVQVAMRQYKPELAEDKDALEDNLDLPTVYKIIDAASGIQLADPTAILSSLQTK
jgi:hypothetical protein